MNDPICIAPVVGRKRCRCRECVHRVGTTHVGILLCGLAVYLALGMLLIWTR